MNRRLTVGIAAFLLLPGLAMAGTQEVTLQEIANTRIRAFAQDPMVIEAIKEQNARNATLSQADIDRLDRQWRAETKSSQRPLIDSVLRRALSAHLASKKNEGAGLYTEIFVMDNKGLNVGQSDVTSDYWQGDEAKWKETYLVGPNAVHVSDVEHDESTQMFQAQISVSVMDPDTHAAIGSVTVGINVDEALR